jgi:hypothetical protein
MSEGCRIIGFFWGIYKPKDISNRIPGQKKEVVFFKQPPYIFLLKNYIFIFSIVVFEPSFMMQSPSFIFAVLPSAVV